MKKNLILMVSVCLVVLMMLSMVSASYLDKVDLDSQLKLKVGKSYEIFSATKLSLDGVKVKVTRIYSSTDLVKVKIHGISKKIKEGSSYVFKNLKVTVVGTSGKNNALLVISEASRDDALASFNSEYANGNNNYCKAKIKKLNLKCFSGEGRCKKDSQCQSGLKCVEKGTGRTNKKRVCEGPEGSSGERIDPTEEMVGEVRFDGTWKELGHCDGKVLYNDRVDYAISKHKRTKKTHWTKETCAVKCAEYDDATCCSFNPKEEKSYKRKTEDLLSYCEATNGELIEFTGGYYLSMSYAMNGRKKPLSKAGDLCNPTKGDSACTTGLYCTTTFDSNKCCPKDTCYVVSGGVGSCVEIGNPVGSQHICNAQNDLTYCNSESYCTMAGEMECQASGSKGAWKTPCSDQGKACSSSGECVATVGCTDTDSGDKDKTDEKGTVTVTDGEGGTTTYTDSCIESEFGANQFQVREYSCNGKVKYGAKRNCKGDCKDGACVPCSPGKTFRLYGIDEDGNALGAKLCNSLTGEWVDLSAK